MDGLVYSYSGSRLSDIRVKIGGNAYLAKAYTYNTDGSVETVKDYYNFKSGDTTSHALLTYGYDVFGRVSAMDYTNNGTAMEKHGYSYDKNGSITKERNVNALAGTDEVREYSYDYRNQLADSTVKNVITETVTVEGEADEDGNPTYTTQTVTREETKLQTAYAYDAAGNRTKKTENGKATTYTYNGLNQLLSESGTGTSLAYTYDADGNQTKVSGTAGGSTVNKTYAYTPENMLETYTEGSKTQNNLYSGDGQRVQKKEGSETTNYFYQAGSVLYTGDGDGQLKTFNLLNGADAFGTERKDGSSHGYYLYTEDAKGSTVNVLDNAGSRVVSYMYDDFGDVTESKASGYSGFENELQYTGAVHDELTGLLYLNARYYEPRTGRFITRDTYRGEKDDSSTWHLYAYCMNNPINYVDPSGNVWETILDVASMGWSAAEFLAAPSWKAAGYLVWDIGAAFIPFIPGSYVKKGLKASGKLKKLTIKVPTKIDELKKGKYLTTGTYRALNKLLKNQKKGRIQVHHIIEKRFAKAFFGLSTNDYASVVLDKSLHKKITKRFNKVAPKGRTVYVTLGKTEMKRIVRYVYSDMPELRQLAMKQIDRYGITRNFAGGAK